MATNHHQHHLLTSASTVIMEEVKQAVLLLQSIGVQQICHPTDDIYTPYVPLCHIDATSTGNFYRHDFANATDGTSSSNDPYFLRGSWSSLTSAAAAAAAEATSSHTEHYPQRNLLDAKIFASLHEEEGYYIYNILGAIFCVSCVALISGLFLGLLTLDILELRIIERASNDEEEKMYARELLPIVEERHQLLVTLLLMNALAYETLPIFLDALVPSWVAILLSTTLIMWFGEILPSGIFTGPHQLYLGYKLAPLTRVFLWIMYPFAKPLALCLDYLVEAEEGDEVYNRGELSALVRIQYEDSQGSPHTKAKWQTKHSYARHRRDDSWHATKLEIIEKANELNPDENYDEETDQQEQIAPPLDPTEVDLIEGALQMKTVVVMDVYTPLSQMFAVAEDLVLDKKGFTDIYRNGFSRVPVYRRNDDDPDDKTAILGLVIVRQLMLIDWDHMREVSTLPLQRPKCLSPRMNLVEALRILRSQGCLMAFVCAGPDLANKALDAEKPIPTEAGFMGIVTLQDIMESLLQERIYDEWDIKDRDRAVSLLQRWAANLLQDFVRKKVKRLRATSIEHSQEANYHGESEPLLNGSSSAERCYKSISGLLN
jgi:metal transporter CNNM